MATLPSRSDSSVSGRALRGIVVVAACGLLFAGGLVLWHPFRSADTPVMAPLDALLAADDARPSLAVLPLDDDGELADAYFAQGIQQELNARLSGVRALRVIAPRSTEAYRERRPSLARIAEELKVAFVVEGSADIVDSAAHLEVRLVDTHTEEVVWEQTYARDFTVTELVAVQSDVAQQIAASLEAVLTPEEQAALEATPTENTEAYGYFLRGIGLEESYRRSELQEGERMLRRAVALDPDFASAHAWLSILHSRVWLFNLDRRPARAEAARAGALRALELAPDLADAHLAQGLVYYRVDLDYDRALKEFARVLEVQPNNVVALGSIASVRRRQGRVDEAIEGYVEAARLNPRYWAAAFSLGQTYYLARRFGPAAEYLERARKLAPDEPRPYEVLARTLVARHGNTLGAWWVYEQARDAGVDNAQSTFTWAWLDVIDRDFSAAEARLRSSRWDAYDLQFAYVPKSLALAEIYALEGDAERAAAHYEGARELLEQMVADRPEDGRLRSSLGVAYAGLGLKEAAVAQGERGVALMPMEREAFRGVYRATDLARIYGMVGDRDKAVALLVHLLSLPGIVTGPLLRVDPAWDPLRGDPRFEALLGLTGTGG